MRLEIEPHTDAADSFLPRRLQKARLTVKNWEQHERDKALTRQLLSQKNPGNLFSLQKSMPASTTPPTEAAATSIDEPRAPKTLPPPPLRARAVSCMGVALEKPSAGNPGATQARVPLN